MNLAIILLIVAIVLFIIASTGRVSSSIDLKALGLAFLAMAFLVPLV